MPGCVKGLVYERKDTPPLTTALAFVGDSVSIGVPRFRYTKVAVGLYYVAAACSTVGLLMGYKFARYTWHMHDFVIGHLLFVILFLLSAMQFPSTVQVGTVGPLMVRWRTCRVVPSQSDLSNIWPPFSLRSGVQPFVRNPLWLYFFASV